MAGERASSKSPSPLGISSSSSFDLSLAPGRSHSNLRPISQGSQGSRKRSSFGTINPPIREEQTEDEEGTQSSSTGKVTPVSAKTHLHSVNRRRTVHLDHRILPSPSSHTDPVSAPDLSLSGKIASVRIAPTLTVESPSPGLGQGKGQGQAQKQGAPLSQRRGSDSGLSGPAGLLGSRSNKLSDHTSTCLAQRRQSQLPLTTNDSAVAAQSNAHRLTTTSTVSTLPALTSSTAMSTMIRKVWVRRANATATQVAVQEDDLVDDVKDLILRKYANSLGRSFDPPDVVLKLALQQRASRSGAERILCADERIIDLIRMHFPNGQKMDDALIIDVVSRRTPKVSPRLAHPAHAHAHAHAHVQYDTLEETRPSEHGADYFPPMPANTSYPSDSSAAQMTSHPSRNVPTHPHSIAILETGQVPPLPSPGSTRARHSERSTRPRYGRQHTSSPSVLSTHGASHNASHNNSHDSQRPAIPSGLPTPPVDLPHRTATPPPTARVSSPRPGPKAKRARKAIATEAATSFGHLDGPPPINVLIVEDNIINLKLLEAFLKRLKVRWSTAMNGKIAVEKWRQGGFHLVLMDIQLPVMNGLDATKEIRRLERVNKIGVFANGAGCSTNGFGDHACEGLCLSDSATGLEIAEIKAKDDLTNTDLFKSPVIIVALTASSLQSDRHEALAAGCNDFLTKPVNFDWLSRKVMEWGCMQALIDFDGWRKWKDMSDVTTKSGPTSNVKISKDIFRPPSNNEALGAMKNAAAAPALKEIDTVADDFASAHRKTHTDSVRLVDGNLSSGGDGGTFSSEGGSSL